LDIDETNSVMQVDCWLQMRWTDSFLQWNPDDYGGLKDLHFSADELWRPDILLYNSADVEKIDFASTHMLVNSNGIVTWIPPAHLKAFCKLDLKYWPHDKQRCNLRFGSWTSHGAQITLGLYNNKSRVEKMQLYTNNREWQITGIPTAEIGYVKYECCEENYPHVDFTFDLQRESPAYRMVIILPCLVLMLTTGCSFLLTPDSGEKLLVSGLSLIGTIMYLIYFATTLLFHQSSVPRIVTFYSNTCGLIGIAILLNVMCISMAKEKKYTGPPKFLTQLFSGCLGKLLCLGNYSHQVSSTHQRLTLELSSLDNVDNSLGEGGDSSYRNGGTRNSGSSSSEARHHAHGLSHTAASIMNHGDSNTHGSILMQDWMMVAAGLERLFFLTYAMAFAIVTFIYV